MAAEKGSESQDDKEILIQKGAVEEVQQDTEAVTEIIKPKASNLTLYHWTQSFNSQKVSVTSVQHHSLGTVPLFKGIR